MLAALLADTPSPLLLFFCFFLFLGPRQNAPTSASDPGRGSSVLTLFLLVSLRTAVFSFLPFFPPSAFLLFFCRAPRSSPLSHPLSLVSVPSPSEGGAEGRLATRSSRVSCCLHVFPLLVLPRRFRWVVCYFIIIFVFFFSFGLFLLLCFAGVSGSDQNRPRPPFVFLRSAPPPPAFSMIDASCRPLRKTTPQPAAFLRAALRRANHRRSRDGPKTTERRSAAAPDRRDGDGRTDEDGREHSPKRKQQRTAPASAAAEVGSHDRQERDGSAEAGVEAGEKSNQHTEEEEEEEEEEDDDGDEDDDEEKVQSGFSDYFDYLRESFSPKSRRVRPLRMPPPTAVAPLGRPRCAARRLSAVYIC